MARRASSRPLVRLLRVLALAVVGLVVLPYAIAVAYLVVPPVSTLMVWRWVKGERVERQWLPLEAMGTALPVAVVVAEDGRYCTHRGVDWEELQEAIEDADDLSEARGGSTIAQQTAKNLFLWPGRSLMRKALEFPLALWLDLILGKRRLMEIYLNIAEWGPNGEFGAEAGARRAFGKSARQVSPHEAALLAAMLPNPARRDARRPGPGLRRLAGLYQGRAQKSAGVADCLAMRRNPRPT